MPDNPVADRAVASFRSAPALLPLSGAVQHYDWGGYEFIPALLGEANPQRVPYAELWIGVHPAAPSTAQIDGTALPLGELIKAAPDIVLGPNVRAAFGCALPYLFKVLDARQMLSIQAHPSRLQAEEGFGRENAAGVPLTAPNRNYKDRNHKPEVQVALTDFWMLHGFRPLEEIASTLEAVPELRPLMPDCAQRLRAAGTNREARRLLLRDLYGAAMLLPQADIDVLLNPLVTRLERENPSDKDSPDYWALRAAREYPLPDGHHDRGIVSIYLLNLVHLRPGEGSYQPSGMLHAYLEGATMELMANSDNVLRGGLTPKHVDVPELMRTLSFESGPCEVLYGEQTSPAERVYRTPCAEFELSRICLAPDTAFEPPANHGPDALIVLEGAAEAVSAGARVSLPRGAIVLAPHGLPYSLRPLSAPATLFRATVPVSAAATV